MLKKPSFQQVSKTYVKQVIPTSVLQLKACSDNTLLSIAAHCSGKAWIQSSTGIFLPAQIAFLVHLGCGLCILLKCKLQIILF